MKSKKAEGLKFETCRQASATNRQVVPIVLGRQCDESTQAGTKAHIPMMRADYMEGAGGGKKGKVRVRVNPLYDHTTDVTINPVVDGGVVD